MVMDRNQLGENPTDAEVAAAYREFRANLGTYTLAEDGTLTIQVRLARGEDFVGEEAVSKRALDGAYLTRTLANGNTRRYHRADHVGVEQ